jgi:uncharacterized protein YggU (UPF0235/DUF167 family)
VDVLAGRIVIRVRAAPADGRATEEARRTLAGALRMPASRVTLLRGRRSRDKVFEVAGMTRAEVLQRFR